MKMRLSYVSNSSSSSFIIGIGIVKPEKVNYVQQLIKNHYELEDSYIALKSTTDFVESFTEDTVSINVNSGDFVLKLYAFGIDPKYNEEIDNYDYDCVDKSYFDNWIINLIQNKDLFTAINYTYGGGYNG